MAVAGTAHSESDRYGSLDVEEFGSVYEGLLEYDPALTQNAEGWSFQFVKGEKRSSSGSHYTPEELVHPLIKHSLAYVVEERLKAGSGLQDKEASRAAKRNALLSIKVCDVACGSGHILLSAARRIAIVLAQVTTDEEQPSPTSFRAALREVIRHCIYGVDKNPLAVELCKVALWLEAHNPGMPLTFLDHRIRCGDAIVGLARREEIERGISVDAFTPLPGDDKEIASLFRKTNKAEVEARLARQESLNYETEFATELKALVSKANELQEQKDDTVEDFHRKRDFYGSMQGAEYWRLKNIADLQIAQFFTPKTSEKRDSLVTDGLYFDVVQNRRASSGNYVHNATALSAEKRFFHWFLEFPEVFEQGGFDCVLGNPPFLGGHKISGSLGFDYLNFLKVRFEIDTSPDLVTFFFLNVFGILSNKKFLGLISTNTIAQGKSRESGLNLIIRDEIGSINYAIRSIHWPGTAAVEVSLICIYKGKWMSDCILDGNRVRFINGFLDDQSAIENPFTLKVNDNKSFQGSIVLGKGFLLAPDVAKRMIANNPQNAEVLFPYLIGEDLNSNPEFAESRWVINFFDWPIERAKRYTDIFTIVETMVKPQRESIIVEKQKAGKQLGVHDQRANDEWWKYLWPRPELYEAIKSHTKVLVHTRVSKTHGFAEIDTGKVFSDATIVFVVDGRRYFSVLQSSIHEVWAWKYSSTMKGDRRYVPTDCFGTFPFPDFAESTQMAMHLDDIGDKYYQARSDLMKLLNVGMTKLHKLFHQRELTLDMFKKEAKQSELILAHAIKDVDKFRLLHKEMNELVLSAYGWSDLDLEHDFHEVEYLPENDRVRYTISERARKEVLRRLLNLNHEIYGEEVKKGLWAKKSGNAKGRKVVISANQESLGL